MSQPSTMSKDDAPSNASENLGTLSIFEKGWIAGLNLEGFGCKDISTRFTRPKPDKNTLEEARGKLQEHLS